MRKEEIRKVKVTYCDLCLNEITPPYTTVHFKNSEEGHFCNRGTRPVKDGHKSCFEEYTDQEIKKTWKSSRPTLNEEFDSEIEITSTAGDSDESGTTEVWSDHDQDSEDTLTLPDTSSNGTAEA